MTAGQWLRERLSLTPRHYLARAQKKSPPRRIPGVADDLGKRLYLSLEDRLPVNIKEQFQSRNAVIGEVGVLTPGAFASPVYGGYAIQVFTGLPDFLYSISRALHAQARIFSGPDCTVVQQPSDTIEKTVTAIELIFRTYRETQKIAKPADYAISQDQKELASALSKHAEAFVVAHEIGHVQIWRTDSAAPRGSSPEQELEADKIALAIVIGMAGGGDTVSRRMAYAGVEFAVRVFAGLEHLGCVFDEGTHPLPTRRLEQVRSAAREFCLTRLAYVRLSTIAMTYDQFLEEMERRLAATGSANRFVLGATADRLLSTISVLVEECVKTKITDEFAIDELTKAFEAAPEDVVRQAAAEAADMYLAEALINPTREDEEFSQREGEKFKELAHRLKKQWRPLFAEAIWHAIGKKGDRAIRIVVKEPVPEGN